MQQRLAAEAAAEVQRQELQQCRQWLQHGKRGGMSQCECPSGRWPGDVTCPAFASLPLF